MSIFRDRAALIWLALHFVCVGCFRRRRRRGLKYNLSLVDATVREKKMAHRKHGRKFKSRIFFTDAWIHLFFIVRLFCSVCFVADAIVVGFAFSSELLSLLLPYFFSLAVCLLIPFIRSLTLSPFCARFSFHHEKWLCLLCRCSAHTGKQMHELLSQDFTFWCCAVCARRFSFFQIKSTLSGFPFDFPFRAIFEQTTSCIVVAVLVYDCFFLDGRKKNSSTSHHKHEKRNETQQIKLNKTLISIVRYCSGMWNLGCRGVCCVCTSGVRAPSRTVSCN